MVGVVGSNPIAPTKQIHNESKLGSTFLIALPFWHSFFIKNTVATKPKKSSDSATSTPPAGNHRIIKKYPNRRLYDTLTSSYITLSDIKQLVMSGSAFRVLDAKTDEDLTRAMLLQIILEAEAGGAPLFSEAVLANLIRTYGHAMQGYMGNFLEQNLQAFADVQKQFTAQASPLAAMQEHMMSMFGMKKP
jgi:polyhydroxyalkanoate synthesis repressor PhaR